MALGWVPVRHACIGTGAASMAGALFLLFGGLPHSVAGHI